MVRSLALNNLPRRKVDEKILSLVQGCETCSKKNITRIEQAYDGLCERCSIMLIAYNRYAESNIQIEYWGLNMNDFVGSPELKKAYTRITENLSKVYGDGMSLCLAGSHGIGKTMTISCILKRACEKNYSCLYTTLNDIVNALIEAPYDDKYLVRKELMNVDFLAIDEFDSKYISDGASDLFARSVEPILRGRSQNKVPLFMCSNSPNPTEAFKGSIKQSIDSIFNRVKVIPILAEDFRKTQKQ